MIHCRKAQNEMVHLLRKYEKELPGGVFHCFTGNQKEAEELLSFDKLYWASVAYLLSRAAISEKTSLP